MAKKVKIYTTSTCSYCKKAKEFLSEKGVEYEAYDVAADSEALKEMRKISGGATSVPVISVGGEVMVGFDGDHLEKLLNSPDQGS
ncbi:hypothetical protein BuS5_02709 [Desulfosarcina sp. BuS5]|uniref:glutaredoxin family protein n=1 Tax=Desulfosarcina sp. BuS5 TaxID=933262 RepID=UPI000488ADBF|nr:glutaredoxin family protein [Desulfosarcina sp. BuS5]WDN89741.1 hypothetical protein BuS5_02709 [Desulfosarcina sp. BuS5]